MSSEDIVNKLKFVSDELRLEGRAYLSSQIDLAIERINELERHLEAKIIILAQKTSELNSLKQKE